MFLQNIKKPFVLVACFLVIGIYQIRAQRITNYISADTAIYRGIVLHDKENYQKAIESYKLVSPNDPSYPLALYEIALSFFESRNHKKHLVSGTYQMTGLKGIFICTFF